MKKKLYFEPKRKTHLNEYVVIKLGKIRSVHYLDIPDERTNAILKSIKMKPKKPEYKVFKEFNFKPDLIKIDSYTRKTKNLEYTHEIKLPNLNIYEESTIKVHPESTQFRMPEEMLLKMFFKEHRLFIKLNLFERMSFNYHSFSWSSLDTNQKIKIVTWILGITITIAFSILKLMS
ncbi:hypothetical protein ACFQ1M_09875 [Sungkyunkwania multivorans]|uniref:Uncharacterized protein n=1 Tax=Sungkyunkwania multivorans TaxID=1173618 RepID=A0ABW3CXJ8_9FLAO